jgi:hypothetical protein
MNEGVYPDPTPDEDEAPLVERYALVSRTRALQTRTRNTRAASRNLVARCVEDRIVSQHRRSKFVSRRLLADGDRG